MRPGDSLWAIALRFYGDGEGYPRIIEANVGRVMADGRPFTRSGVIQPGWELRVPLPERALASGTTEVTTYVVQPGDSLSGIAGRLWGRPEAWVDLFALNQGTARLADGRVLTRPELIWPGLPLAVPLAPGHPEHPGHPELALSVPTATAAHEGDPAVPDVSPLATPPSDALSPDALSPDAPLPDAPLPAAEVAVEAAGLPETGPAVPDSLAHAPAGASEFLAQAPPGEAAPPAAPAAAVPHGAASPETPAPAPALAQASAPDAPPETGARAPGATRITVPGSSTTPVALPRPGQDLLSGAGAAAPPRRPRAAGAAGVVAWRRRARRSLAQPPPGGPLLPLRYRGPAEVAFEAGFAELDVTRPLLHRLGGGDGDAVAGAAWLVRRFLDEHALQGVGILTVVYGRDATGLTLDLSLRATPAEQGRLVALAPALGARLGGAGQAEPAPPGDVQLTLSEVRSIGLVAPGGGEGTVLPGAVPLIPVGAVSRRRVLVAAWDEVAARSGGRIARGRCPDRRGQHGGRPRRAVPAGRPPAVDDRRPELPPA